ncbi:uncharacterized protein PHACADRAFT_167306 [Phanerochaete carnosa HHB-10118-sp]|uniref:DUF6534 domain-containing protein n=1 Tax=Phanerochaete carnosa (strain HHB-10118-sp) TaxID=650164 RepID=K5WG00_PHACS|nr:uncharacterized protein PHACADRAFT_167306 [Phanerochaete carnosa HHB-10118-sp]EKM49132.1 hypothetical protein PHACADRAFT_167306 [Phanerochaete carnosa HHB-10118-sp]
MVSAGGQAAQILHGPSLVGIFLNILLYGVVIAQAHTYYASFRSDPLWIKAYVAVLLLADTLNSAFNIAWIYTVLVNNFGNLAALTQADWRKQKPRPLLHGLIAMMVQLFYAWRILALTKNRWIVALVVVSSTVSGLSAIGTAIGIGIRPEFSGFKSLDVIGLPWLISCTVCDVTIAVALSVYLNSRKTGFEITDNIINKIIRSTVQSGLLTASFTIAHIVAYLTSSTGIHMIFNYGVVKLYTNSVMSSLNSRQANSHLPSGDTSFIDAKEVQKEFSSLYAYNLKGHAFLQSNFVSSRSVRPQVSITVEMHEMADTLPLPKAKSGNELVV